jgi:Protein of unknown function (DUF4239)
MMAMSVTMHPIWQSGVVILAAGIAAALVLQLLVHHFLPASVRRQHTELGGVIFSVIGTTYAVLLAFMATTAWEQHSAAEDLSRHEADLIGRLYSASQGIPDPKGAAIRDDLRAYLVQIIDVEWPAQVAGRKVPVSESHLERLDQVVFGLIPANAGQAAVQQFLIRVVSDLAAARRDRRLATHGTIPGLVWVILLSGGALVVAFSFVLGAPAQALHLVMTAALVASGLLVLLLIIGLSSPFHGAVTISPEPYSGVLDEMPRVR